MANPYVTAAYNDFVIAQEAILKAQQGTNDTAMQNFMKALDYYCDASGEMLRGILERVEDLHSKIDRVEKKVGSVR